MRMGCSCWGCLVCGGRGVLCVCGAPLPFSLALPPSLFLFPSFTHPYCSSFTLSIRPTRGSPPASFPSRSQRAAERASPWLHAW